jgi:hypothetical protein
MPRFPDDARREQVVKALQTQGIRGAGGKSLTVVPRTERQEMADLARSPEPCGRHALTVNQGPKADRRPARRPGNIPGQTEKRGDDRSGQDRESGAS